MFKFIRFHNILSRLKEEHIPLKAVIKKISNIFKAILFNASN
jgi:hypothetical protein